MDDFPQRLVFVDDEQGLRETVRAAMQDSGYKGVLATCGSGEELLNCIGVLQPELIVLDMKMPDMDGPAVMSALHANPETGNIPIVICTGLRKLEMAALYKSLGVIGVIHKPLNLGNFIEDIRVLWNSHRVADAAVEAG